MTKVERRFYEIWDKVTFSYAIELLVEEFQVRYLKIFKTEYENRIALLNEKQEILGDLPEYMGDGIDRKDVLNSLRMAGTVVIL